MVQGSCLIETLIKENFSMQKQIIHWERRHLAGLRGYEESFLTKTDTNCELTSDGVKACQQKRSTEVLLRYLSSKMGRLFCPS